MRPRVKTCKRTKKNRKSCRRSRKLKQRGGDGSLRSENYEMRPSEFGFGGDFGTYEALNTRLKNYKGYDPELNNNSSNNNEGESSLPVNPEATYGAPIMPPVNPLEAQLGNKYRNSTPSITEPVLKRTNKSITNILSNKSRPPGMSRTPPKSNGTNFLY